MWNEQLFYVYYIMGPAITKVYNVYNYIMGPFICIVYLLYWA